MPPAAILDIDGTLVDTNYHHAIAWYRAFRRQGVVVPVWRIHRHIGMGGDQLVGAVAGDEVEKRLGDAVRAAQDEEYSQLIGETAPFEGAAELLRTLKRRGHRLVLASSAKPHEVEHYLGLLDAAELADGTTTSADVEATKPQPDLVLAAMEQAGDDRAVMIGDSTWDCEAAKRAGIPAIAILTGGFSEQELRDAGAVAVYESIAMLAERLDAPPLT
ncbi:MAG TPA: HAD family hydrolase [Actinomycetes bacterium]